jgi:DNA-binding GntR family transcriptional regulator
MSRRLAPGERVRQVDIANRLGVSSVPVREALQTLEAEEQVTYEPHRGYTVARLSIQEVEEIYRMRELLEREATRQAVPRVDEDLIWWLRERLLYLNELIESHEMLDYTEANRDFHLRLFEQSGMPRFVRTIERLWQNSEAARGSIFDDPGWKERTKNDHQNIVDACEARDVEAAIRAQDEHRVEALASIKRLYRKAEECDQ